MSKYSRIDDAVATSRLPCHVAIIPDGNGRWAQERSLSRMQGHVRGTANAKDIVTFAKELGIKILTIYAFSEENWLRPKDEINALMTLLKEYLSQERENILKNKIQLRAIGNIERLPEAVLKELVKTIEMSRHNGEMILNFAISYGGRQELLGAVRKIASLCQKGEVSPEEIDQKFFSKFLYTAGLADPDLLIRTSGEMRVSNFLLWQIAYTELYVTKTLWPDFNRKEFLKAILEYQRRERRYGMTSEQRGERGENEVSIQN